MPNVIRLGDPTSHGGEVISASASDYLVDGKPVALAGHHAGCGAQLISTLGDYDIE